MRTGRRFAAIVLVGALGLPGPARAGGPRDADTTTEVPVPERATEVANDAAPDDGSKDMAGEAGPKEPAPEARPEGPPPPTGALQEDEGQPIAVAVGLGPSAPGTRHEKAITDALERSARASARPRTTVRRLRAGVGEAREVCRERRDDLVILVEYLPDRTEPVLLAQDCRTQRALGVRAGEAAGHPELVGALWDEHEQLVKEGVLEKRRTRLGPKVRTGLIAGGAVLAVGVAIAVILVSSLRRETVVLTVSP
jgi:hypothetical protein